jgi:hypothetical protein
MVILTSYMSFLSVLHVVSFFVVVNWFPETSLLNLIFELLFNVHLKFGQNMPFFRILTIGTKRML